MDHKKTKNAIVFATFLFGICFLHSVLTTVELSVLLYNFYKNVAILVFAPFIYLLLNSKKENVQNLDIKYFIFSMLLVLYLISRVLREGFPS
ncbi:MAG: hypothetical protein KC646_08595 [Candidatus Cloacimonetes bacterium]|nr:hypothetical protein [Candidatus Cloacimonadota bacterium]